MKKTYTYDERLFANVPPYDSPKAYEMSRDKFDQGAYLESIHYLLDSFNPTARLRYDDELEKKTEKKASFFSRLFLDLTKKSTDQDGASRSLMELLNFMSLFLRKA